MSKRHQLLALAATLSVLTVGCQVGPLRLASGVPGAAQASSADYGNVEIAVRWPQRVQAIPYSANTLVVQAFDSLGRDAGMVALHRANNDDLQVASMRLKADTYTIEARAYRETDPDSTSVPTAMGSAANVVIKTDLKTNLSLTLVAQAPTFGAMSAAAGGIGSQFTLDTVRFFNRPATLQDVIEVWFGYDSRTRVRANVSIMPRRSIAPITGINQLMDPEQDKLVVTVPAGIAGQPKVWLKVDGVEVLVGTFRVVDRMVIEPTSITRQVGEWYDATTNLQNFSLDATTALSYPVLTWSSSDPTVAFVTAMGLVYAYKPGRATITAKSGSLSTTFDLVATDRQSTASVNVNMPVVDTGPVSAPITIPAYSGDDTGTVNQ